MNGSSLKMIVLIALAICIGALLMGCKSSKNDSAKTEDENLTSFEKDVKYLTEDVSVKIFVYGEDLEFPLQPNYGKKPEYTRINELSEQELMPDGTADYYALIIHDWYEHAPLYEKDYELIKKLLATKKYYTFVYIGKRFRQSLVDYGVWGNGDGLGVIDDENSLSIMYYHGNFSYGWGPIDDALFTEEGFYPYHVGEALIMCVASDIRENR